jgi:hypothetical protein
MRAVIDKAVAKVVSRKFTVFILSTLFLYFDKLSGDQWVAVSLGYIGLQGIADIATQWKHGGIR